MLQGCTKVVIIFIIAYTFVHMNITLLNCPYYGVPLEINISTYSRGARIHILEVVDT